MSPTALTIEELQAILRAAHARVGQDGRFALTLTLQPEEECYITHWFRPSPYAFEDCRMVARGTVADCLKALEAYITAYRQARHAAE
ncbi:MAG TPA: hypothetical protein VEB64_01805 [Azospirillaceae bacterium]|nr:hypothetical protein [Azospirillaceae bacterium]